MEPTLLQRHLLTQDWSNFVVALFEPLHIDVCQLAHSHDAMPDAVHIFIVSMHRAAVDEQYKSHNHMIH